MLWEVPAHNVGTWPPPSNTKPSKTGQLKIPTQEADSQGWPGQPGLSSETVSKLKVKQIPGEAGSGAHRNIASLCIEKWGFRHSLIWLVPGPGSFFFCIVLD